jgi:hypothetical protein
MQFPIEQLGSIGLVLDAPGYALSGPAITGGSNFRCDGESLVSANGYSLFKNVNDGADVPVYHMDGIQDITGNIYYDIFCGSDKVFAFDGTTLTAITPAAPLTSSVNWATDVINGNFVFTNGIDAPYYWDMDVAHDMVALPGWNATSCEVIRSFKGFLIALDIVKGGTHYPYRFKWSQYADSGLPASWDETNPATKAGETDLGDGEMALLDGRALGDLFIVYGQNKTIATQFIGGNSVWRWNTIFNNIGILARNCVCQFQDYHFVVTIGDCIYHDGSTWKSAIDRRNRKKLFSSIDSTYYYNTFVATYPALNEIWVCYPSQGNTYPNKALVWNYDTDTWSPRDLPENTTHIIKAIKQTGAPPKWSDLTTVKWSEMISAWDGQSFNPSINNFIASSTDANIYQLDDTQSANGIAMNKMVERTGIRVGEASDRHRLKYLYPRVSGSPVQFEVGFADGPEMPYTWNGPYSYDPALQSFVDCNISGYYFGIRMYSEDYWKFSSIELEYVKDGRT